MEPFTYARPAAVDRALADGEAPRTAYIAGGTTLVDLMRLEVMRPGALVDIRALPYAQIEDLGDRVRIGALVRNSDLAQHAVIAARYTAIAEALLAGASPQIRNLATTGGNLLQRTRCPYFRDPQVAACNKRTPGSGCAALDGHTRSHAVLGTSERCIATNPSDLNVALAALGATVHTRTARRARRIAFGELHTLPGQHPEIETVLEAGELITHVEVPALPSGARSHYVKVRDRAAFAFALASAAVAIELGGGTIRSARIALGGIATRPWRSVEAERVLVGQRPGRELFRAAATAALADARPHRGNEFKIELAQRTLVRALVDVTGGAA